METCIKAWRRDLSYVKACIFITLIYMRINKNGISNVAYFAYLTYSPQLFIFSNNNEINNINKDRRKARTVKIFSASYTDGQWRAPLYWLSLGEGPPFIGGEGEKRALHEYTLHLWAMGRMFPTLVPSGKKGPNIM